MHRLLFFLATCSVALLPVLSAATAATAVDRRPPPSVLVIGGTPAGVAAAIAAARHGLTVTLASRSSALGGVLTDAMMDQWDLNRAPGGERLQGGIFNEMFARLGDAFEPADAARELGAMVAAQPRIRVLPNLEVASVASEAVPGGRRVDAVTFHERKRNRLATIAADIVIDATDDADVAALAGARYDVGRQDTGIDERMQSVTLMFSLSGVAWNRVEYAYDPARYGAGFATNRRAWGYSNLVRDYHPIDGNTIVRDLNFGRLSNGNVTVNAVDLCGINGMSAPDRDRATSLARRESYALVGFLRAHLHGFERARIANFAASLYVRETRHVGGLERLTSSDIWNGRIPDDSIGLSSYPIDLHPVVPSETPAFASGRHVYGVPFGALVPAGLTNVVLASPSISASHQASGSSRVVPTTIEEGEAAGVAAALAVFGRVDVATIARTPARMETLRHELRADGVILVPPPDAIEPPPGVIATHATWDVLSAPLPG